MAASDSIADEAKPWAERETQQITQHLSDPGIG